MNCKKLPVLEPVCFTIIMGTGVFSITCFEMADIIPGLAWLAWGLNILNYCLFFFLAGWAIWSWTSNRSFIRENFNTPASCALYSAAGIALLVLAAQALRFGIGELLGIFLWISGTILTLSLNFTIMFRFFMHTRLELAHITPVLFVPVAGLVVVPVAGAPISLLTDGVAKDVIIMGCTLSLGGGVVLYSGLFSMMLQRHLLVAPLPDKLAPTLWIHMAPLGWTGVSLTVFAKYILPPEYTPAAMLLALLLFGASLWWGIMVAAISLRAAKKQMLPFSLSWWAFVFPIGSLVVLSKNLDLRAANEMFPFLWGLLAVLWMGCALRTIISCTRRASNQVKDQLT